MIDVIAHGAADFGPNGPTSPTPKTPTTERRSDRRAAVRRALAEHGGLMLALLVLFVILTFNAPNFYTETNLTDVARQMSFTGLIAFGMTFVIVAGEIDISVGSAIAMGSALLGVLVVQHDWSLPAAIAAVIASGTFVGLIAGLLRARLGVPSFIVTLALFSALAGMALLITDAIPQPIPNADFARLAAGQVGPVPYPTIFMLIVFAICWFVATRTSFGRSVYAIGGNADAAHLSGIPVARVRTAVFAITGFLAAVSAVLLSSQLTIGTAQIGQGTEFDVITAVIVGGASLYGGKGSMFGTLLGVMFIGILGNGMVLMGVTSYAQQVAHGVIVLLAVLMGLWRGNGISARRLLGTRTDASAEGKGE